MWPRVGLNLGQMLVQRIDSYLTFPFFFTMCLCSLYISEYIVLDVRSLLYMKCLSSISSLSGNWLFICWRASAFVEDISRWLMTLVRCLQRLAFHNPDSSYLVIAWFSNCYSYNSNEKVSLQPILAFTTFAGL